MPNSGPFGALRGQFPQPPCLCQRAGDSAEGGSGRLRGEGGGDSAEQRLVGVRAAHQQPHPAGVGQRHRAHLEQREADGVRRRLGQLRRRQRHAAHPLDQSVGQAAEQQAVLVGVEVARRGPVGEQAELLVLDPVLHLAALAVQPLGVVPDVQVCDHEARVRPQVGVLRLGDQPPLARLAPGRVAELVEKADLPPVQPVCQCRLKIPQKGAFRAPLARGPARQ